MKFRNEQWTISKLVGVHKDGNLNINPPYQRRFIWSLEDQRILIESIVKNYPIPNIFLLEKSPGKFEVVDGQQRTRTILGFLNQDFSNFEGKLYAKQDFPNFENFTIPVIIVEEIEPGDLSIEEFYGLVNSAGVHLNRPEIKKAEYYDTKFLKLINDCNAYENFQNLGLFTDTVLKRMNDMDFVSEIIVRIKDGITDKKERVDRTFEQDITETEYNALLAKFKATSDNIFSLNRLFPIKKTRYKQRNDFYTVFGFLNDFDLNPVFLSHFYQILVLVGGDISPSNDECLSFQNYARNCITQSNSKSARQERQNFLEALFLNENQSPNSTQKDILTFYNMLDSELKAYGVYHTIDLNRLKSLKPSISFNS